MAFGNPRAGLNGDSRPSRVLHLRLLTFCVGFGPSFFRMTKRGVKFNGGSRHDRNRQNRHGRLLALYFIDLAKGGQGALQNRRNRQNRQNRHEGYPPSLNSTPLFRHPDVLISWMQLFAWSWIRCTLFRSGQDLYA